jgi:hypothetical protein
VNEWMNGWMIEAEESEAIITVRGAAVLYPVCQRNGSYEL